MSKSTDSCRKGTRDCWEVMDSRLDDLPALPQIWQKWTTQLDTTPYRYILPDEYEILSRATNVSPPFVEASCGPISMRFLSRQSETDVLTGMYKPEMTGGNDKVDFLRFLCEDMKDPEKAKQWDLAYDGSVKYVQKHRWLVRLVGEMLGVDMDDHDLTKTKVVVIALAYMWHWPGEKDVTMNSMLNAVVTTGHLQREDHHPQYIGGEVCPPKLFCDRLAVHIQKDPNDAKKGWDIDKWIPADLHDNWQEFKGKYQHMNLYEVLDQPDPGAIGVCIEGQP